MPDCLNSFIFYYAWRHAQNKTCLLFVRNLIPSGNIIVFSANNELITTVGLICVGIGIKNLISDRDGKNKIGN